MFSLRGWFDNDASELADIDAKFLPDDGLAMRM